MRCSAGSRRLGLMGAMLPALIAFSHLVAWAEPVVWPATRAGWQEEIRDERDTAPYLAFHQARAAERAARLVPVGARETPNQDAYDARFYDLDLTLTPSSQRLDGRVLTRATVTAGPLNTLDLDLDNLMTITSVTIGGSPAAYTHTADMLTVTLDRAYATGESVEIVVTYFGNPAPGGAFGWDTISGYSNPWSLSEPYGSRTWWPCKDWSDDKADSVHVRIVAPTGYVTASNGAQVSHTDNGTTAVDVWRHQYPIATYLVSIASYPYAVYSDWYHSAPNDSTEIQFFIYPADLNGVLAVQDKVKTMMAAFRDRFGEYPFLTEKYGHAEFPWGGGMEHQTCTSLGYFGESVVAHELAHQWWGDMVTCDDFHHIWLNEGFATYSEALWWESNGGEAALHQDMAFNTYYGPGTIYVPDLNDWNRIFDSNLSYNKPSWVLHMLRHIMGDADFFASLAAYRQQHEYGTATTEEFRDICESVSGKDLHSFFQEWIYGEYYPAYEFDYSYAPAGGGYDVTVTVRQTQSWQIFDMPVDLTVHTNAGQTTFVVQNNLAEQDFVLHVTDTPQFVTLDENNWILKTVQEPVVNPPFDRGVLLVNGVEWNTYGAEILSSYQDKAFWGDYTIDFWDIFDEPPGGYPSTLPAPVGHGTVPANVIGHYRNVIWVGNNYAGDLSSWLNSPIMNYVQAGGNLLLMTRNGDQFINDAMRDYLGITWITTGTIYDCVASYTGLTNIARIGTQNGGSMFNLLLGHVDSRVIYQAQQNYNPDRGIGVWREPAEGGTYRPAGAQFIFLSGRPYRWDHTNLKTNVMYMLEHFFHEPVNPADVDGGAEPLVLRLLPSRPNPGLGGATVAFSLPSTQEVQVDLLDVGGRRVREIARGTMSAGPHSCTWDGRDERGHPLAAGTYWVRLRADGDQRTQKLTLVR